MELHTKSQMIMRIAELSEENTLLRQANDLMSECLKLSQEIKSELLKQNEMLRKKLVNLQ